MLTFREFLEIVRARGINVHATTLGQYQFLWSGRPEDKRIPLPYDVDLDEVLATDYLQYLCELFDLDPIDFSLDPTA